MPHAIRIHKTGGPEVLTWEEIALDKPGPGQVRLRQTAVGLNYIDTYNRRGIYPLQLPSGLGGEGAGIVEEIGPNVADLQPGDRVAYASGPIGAYAEARLMPADWLVKVPAGVTDQQAAAMMLKGLTAQYLLHRTFRVKKGQTILVHAAAGGVGQILCQWAKALGAHVIGTVGSEEKAKFAAAAGAKHTILYKSENFAEAVQKITKGALCDVVYDGIGKATFPDSLDCIRPLGMFVSFGSASGQIDAFSIGLLQQKGSLFATRPTLVHYIAKREDFDAMAEDLFEVVLDGDVKIPIHASFPLAEAAEAHRMLESRESIGSTILLP
jgi:NADPH2:quinone reductase